MAKKRKKKLKTRTASKKKAVKAAKRPSAKRTGRTAKKAAKKTARKSKKKKAAAGTTSPRKTAKSAMIERELEEGLIETFPASDPVAVTDPTTTIKE